MINTITEYIKHIPLDAYSMGQKSLHQNSKYWGVQIPDSAWKCQRSVQVMIIQDQYDTSKHCLVSALPNTWNFDANSFDPYYRHPMGCVWYRKPQLTWNSKLKFLQHHRFHHTHLASLLTCCTYCPPNHLDLFACSLSTLRHQFDASRISFEITHS